jgi:hypothetical protein
MGPHPGAPCGKGRAPRNVLCFHAAMSSKRNDYREARRLARKAFHRQHGLCFWCKSMRRRRRVDEPPVPPIR